VHDQIVGLRKEMHEGLGAINRRLDQIIQMQLDEHAARIKKRGTAVFSKQFLLFACNLAADTIPFVAPRLSRSRDAPSHPLPLAREPSIVSAASLEAGCAEVSVMGEREA
jgi:hypothetical protein